MHYSAFDGYCKRVSMKIMRKLLVGKTRNARSIGEHFHVLPLVIHEAPLVSGVILIGVQWNIVG